VQSESLVMALKGATPELREKVFRNMSSRAAETLREDLESRGPVRLSEVEAEQKEMLKIVRRLVDEGQIVLAGGGDEQPQPDRRLLQALDARVLGPGRASWPRRPWHARGRATGPPGAAQPSCTAPRPSWPRWPPRRWNAVLLSARHITVQVHPQDLPLVAPARKEVLAGPRRAPAWRSPGVERGGCRVERRRRHRRAHRPRAGRRPRPALGSGVEPWAMAPPTKPPPGRRMTFRPRPQPQAPVARRDVGARPSPRWLRYLADLQAYAARWCA
jgi:hypothetical protein